MPSQFDEWVRTILSNPVFTSTLFDIEDEVYLPDIDDEPDVLVVPENDETFINRNTARKEIE
ncbi:hypothetical protein SEA_FEDE_23 [Microbacterium phage Fede]|nr:hypothetical protein SEA_FEDE_23 [Microbacterium phage Fede]